MMQTHAQALSHPYAKDGLFGVMVPYGNFATEWELSVLMPKPSFFITTRLTDDGGDLAQRVSAYFDPHRLARAVASFGSTPLRAIGVACSATSYFVGSQREEEVFAELALRHGTPFIRAAAAMKDGLDALGTRAVELISPYPAQITDKCTHYWRSLGYSVTAVHQLTNPNPGFHPIYTLTPADIEHAMTEAVRGAKAPVLITGTGLSSLPVIHKLLTDSRTSSPPILSATLCMARSMLGSVGKPLGADGWFTSQAGWLHAAPPIASLP